MKFSEYSNTAKAFVVIIIVLIIGIILRWGYIKSRVIDSFHFFDNTNKVEEKNNI